MNYIHIITFLIYTVCALLIYINIDKIKNINIPSKYILSFFIILGLIIRFSLAGETGLQADITFFTNWSNLAYTHGLFDVYNAGVFLDYPPGYIYILYLINAVANFLNIQAVVANSSFILLLKTPAIIADALSCIFIYKISLKYNNDFKSLFFAILYYLSPVVIFNSAVWGQIDGYYTLLIAISLYFISNDNIKGSAISYAFALATKPQSLLFGPVLLYYILQKKDFSKFITAAIYGLTSFYIFTLPISKGYDLVALFKFYMATFSGYKHFTVNAFNIYYLLGLNKTPTTDFLFASHINTIVILIICLIAAYYFFKSKADEKYFTSAIFIMLFIFNFATMMHERYLFPVVLFSILAAIISKKDEFIIFSMAISFSNHLNVSSIYDNADTLIVSPLIYFLSILALFIASIHFLSLINAPLFNKIKVRSIYYTAPMLATVALFFIITHLGYNISPSTFYQSQMANEEIILTLPEKTNISKIYYFQGVGDEFTGSSTAKTSSDFTIYYSDENNEYIKLQSIADTSKFAWKKLDINTVFTSSLKIVANSQDAILSEIVLIDENENLITPTFTYNSEDFGVYSPNHLFDEQHLFFNDTSKYYSITHKEADLFIQSYNLTQGYTISYENHSHLAIFISAIGLFLFGVNPFGFRILGAVVFIFLSIFFYFASKKITNKNYNEHVYLIPSIILFLLLSVLNILTFSWVIILFLSFTGFAFYMLPKAQKRSLLYKISITLFVVFALCTIILFL